MPVTRSRTSSEQSAPEVVTEDVKQEDKDNATATSQVPDTKENDAAVTSVTATAPVDANDKEEAPEEIEEAEEEKKEESNSVGEADESEDGSEVVNEVAPEKTENGVKKRKSIEGETPEVPDSTEVVVKKAKVDDVPEKVAEAAEESEKPAVEASA